MTTHLLVHWLLGLGSATFITVLVVAAVWFVRAVLGCCGGRRISS